MPVQLIKSNPDFKKELDKVIAQVQVAEMFSSTLQGEGVSTGVPSTFLRVQDCTLDCTWCDSTEVWRKGNPYGVHEILDLFELHGVVEQFRNNHHLVLTGGSPVKRQQELANLISAFEQRFGFKPFIEVENECMIEPMLEFIDIVDQWNNSPKLSNSGMKERIRYKPTLLKRMSELPNSWFKFVIDCEEDWQEVSEFFLPLIKKEQIILMPCGSNQEELSQTREVVVELAIKHNVRFSDREHINIWNRKTGV